MLIFLLSSTASAWNHSQWLWSRDDLPLQWWMSDYAEDSLPEGYQIEVMSTAFDNWITDAPCAQLSQEYMGIREGHHAQGQNSGDDLNTIYFDDPLDYAGGGVLGVTYTVTTGELAFSRNGLNYYYAEDSDIVFSKNIDWATSEDIDNGVCSGEMSIEGVGTHEVGHLWGMAHSCEEEDVDNGDCTDTDLLNATMFWTAGAACTRGQSDLNVDDIEGITALYGPYATFDATTETRGGVPLEVCFDLSSNSAITEAEWLFGDGEVDTTDVPEICHTYTEQGQFTINVTIRGSDDSCGEWEYTERERALVVVCEPPQPAEGFTGMFTYERAPDYDDEEAGTLGYQMINQADISVYGCIEQAQWDIFQGDTLINSVKAWSPILTLPGEGDYTVVLNLGGPGGISAEEAVITASSAGCSTLGAGAGLAGIFFSVLGAGVRRRRD